MVVWLSSEFSTVTLTILRYQNVNGSQDGNNIITSQKQGLTYNPSNPIGPFDVSLRGSPKRCLLDPPLYKVSTWRVQLSQWRTIVEQPVADKVLCRQGTGGAAGQPALQGKAAAFQTLLGAEAGFSGCRRKPSTELLAASVCAPHARCQPDSAKVARSMAGAPA